MKTLLLSGLLIISGFFLQAQSIKKIRPVKEEEVPVAVRRAFEQDFGKIPENGFWTVDFFMQKEGSRTILKPLMYAYIKRSKVEKIEVRYTPEGRLDFVKGIHKIGNNTPGDTTTSA